MKTSILVLAALLAFTAASPAQTSTATTRFEKTYTDFYACKVAALKSLVASGWEDLAVELVVDGADYAFMVHTYDGQPTKGVYLWTCTGSTMKLQEVR